MSFYAILDQNLLVTQVGEGFYSHSANSEKVLGTHISELLPEIGDKLNLITTGINEVEGEAAQPVHSLGEITIDGGPKKGVFHLWSIRSATQISYLLARIVPEKKEACRSCDFKLADLKRYKAISEICSIGILQLDARWRCNYSSAAWVEMSGHSSEKSHGHAWADAIHHEDRAPFLSNLIENLTTKEMLECEIRLLTPLGRERWVSVQTKPLYMNHGIFSGAILLIHDTHEKRLAEDQLKQLATSDTLTGLANRYSFHRFLKEAITGWRPGREFTVAIMDLDGFKAINDVHGHPVGDLLLKEVANRLRDAVRADDKVARTGGDEFAILLGQVNNTLHLELIVEKILHAIARPYQITQDSGDSYIFGSLGLATTDNLLSDIGHDHTEDQVETIAERLMSQADMAMYRAKGEEKGGFRFYQHSLDEEAKETMAISNALHRFTRDSSFDLHYQPQFLTGNGELAGYEALLRWPFSEPDHCPTARFIPLLESSGLMNKVGRWIIDESFRNHAQILAMYPKNAPPKLSVNLSSVQFRDGRLAGYLKNILAVHRIPPETVIVEITETVLMDSYAEIGSQLQEIKKLGLGIALDDFGTGYSSLSYLHKFPIDIIKIDQSFIQNQHQRESRQIVHAITALASSLEKTTVAEGVESTEQEQLAKREGCTLVQGWLYGKAMPLTELVDSVILKPRGLSENRSRSEGKLV